MGKRIRVTGDNPPIHLLGKYPNWENCWDEEGEEDQDETTLRPSANQRVIHEDVTFTAGDATFADGQSHPAILAGFEGAIEDVWVYSFEDNTKCWGLAGKPGEPVWSAYRAREGISPAPHQSEHVLPIVVQSRLPLGSTGQRIRLEVQRIGGEC